MTETHTRVLSDVTIGTSAGNIPVLDSGGKLVSGVIPSAIEEASLSIKDGRALMLYVADLRGIALNFSEGQADPFDSDTIGSTSTNETYDASNDWYTSSSNMTLINGGLTASSAPTTGRITVQAEFVDSSTINTDLTAEISRDGGTNWTTATLTAGAVNGNFTLYEGNATISGQPSGTSMKFRVKTLNNKEIRVSGIVLRWT